MISSEAAPFAKTGGLADVVGALPLALRAFGDEVAVVIPRYGSIDLKNRPPRLGQPRRLLRPRPPIRPPSIRRPPNIPLYLVDCPPLFDRKGFYGEPAWTTRTTTSASPSSARAALGVARVLFRTDIFHCHDWQAGLVPAYLRTTFATDPTFLGCRTLFTIHNLGYQGLFPQTALAEVGARPRRLPSRTGMEFFGQVSYIKGGIAFADALNTVSPTYAREIQTPEYGFGLDGVLRARADVLTGILNGVDYAEWSPELDPPDPRPLLAPTTCRGKARLQAPAAARIRPAGGGHGPAAARHRLALHRAEGHRPDGRNRRPDGRRRRLPGGARHRRARVRGLLPPHAAGVSRAGSRCASGSTTAWPTGSRRARTCSSCPAATNPAG